MNFKWKGIFFIKSLSLKNIQYTLHCASSYGNQKAPSWLCNSTFANSFQLYFTTYSYPQKSSTTFRLLIDTYLNCIQFLSTELVRKLCFLSQILCLSITFKFSLRICFFLVRHINERSMLVKPRKNLKCKHCH